MSAPEQNSNPYDPPVDINTATPPPKKGSQFAPCPGCGRTEAKKVSWTFWGGALGPKMFNHVRCTYCSTTYNGKTGNSNATAIAIYLVVSLVIGAIAGVALALFFMK